MVIRDFPFFFLSSGGERVWHWSNNTALGSKQTVRLFFFQENYVVQYATQFIVANFLIFSTIYHLDSNRQQAHFVNEEVKMKALKLRLLWFYMKASAL